jgi:hypothetical protein
LSLHALGAESMGTFGSHVASLAGYSIVFFMIAMRKLASGGVRMFGGANGARPAGFPLQRVLSRAVFFAGIGLIIGGFMGGSVRVEAHDAGGPVGTPAPAESTLANFDDGTAKASYGLGWNASDDKTMGGDSTAAVRVVGDGAENSKGALEVSGTVRSAAQYPSAGTSFAPKSWDEGAFVDYSNKHTLKFFARGDGRQYTVLFLVGKDGGIPPMYSFTAGADWQEVRIELGALAGMDLKRVRAILILSMNPGDFRFALDNVRLE